MINLILAYTLLVCAYTPLLKLEEQTYQEFKGIANIGMTEAQSDENVKFIR